MSDRALRLLAAALALGGAAVMGYLLYVRHGGGVPVCTGDGCATVQHSRYAEIFGLPVAALGLGGYLAILVLGARPVAQAFVVLTALGFSTYLLLVQLLAIGAVCEWCLTADVLTTGLAAIALVRLGRTPV